MSEGRLAEFVDVSAGAHPVKVNLSPGHSISNAGQTMEQALLHRGFEDQCATRSQSPRSICEKLLGVRQMFNQVERENGIEAGTGVIFIERTLADPFSLLIGIANGMICKVAPFRGDSELVAYVQKEPQSGTNLKDAELPWILHAGLAQESAKLLAKAILLG